MWLVILILIPVLISSDPLPYAEWAHYHMVWLHNSHTNQADIEAMFSGYADHRIPVGIVNVDSCWENGFNTFIFNSTTFPNVRSMFDSLRAQNIHIILWMTSFVNIDSPNYQYAQDHGYLFNTTLQWWHGEGRLLNYFNEDAVHWWHSQIESMLDTVGPIHAFKADESDRYIEKVHDSKVTWLQYRTAYYKDTFDILRRLIGSDALIMSRPVDQNVEWSPRDIVFMGWVGDEDATYDGLKTAIKYMLESGRRGYVGFGSDIGGYRANTKSGPLGRTKELFLRWTAIGALSSFMENGGEGEHLPWNFDDETVRIYRKWVNLHYSFIPYLYSEGVKAALSQNNSLMKPCTEVLCTISHAYHLGSSTYVVPVLNDPEPNQKQRIWFPASSTGNWVSVFNASMVHKAHSFYSEDTSVLDRIPFYIQQGTFIPMYDIELDSQLNTYRFVLWGRNLVTDSLKVATLFTKDGQEWKLELDCTKKLLTTHFLRLHTLNKNLTLIKNTFRWRFCQYTSEEPICEQTPMILQDGYQFQLNTLL